MKKLSLFAYPLVALVSMVAAGAALAESPTPDHTADALSLKSRAEVRAELFQARADGSIKVSSNQYNPLLVAKSLKSRQEVRVEAHGAQDAVWYGEDSGSFALSRQLPARQAQPLLAQAR